KEVLPTHVVKPNCVRSRLDGNVGSILCTVTGRIRIASPVLAPVVVSAEFGLPVDKRHRSRPDVRIVGILDEVCIIVPTTGRTTSDNTHGCQWRVVQLGEGVVSGGIFKDNLIVSGIGDRNIRAILNAGS